MADELDEKGGYVWHLTKPLKKGYVACLKINPHNKQRKDVRLDRDLGRDMAMRLAIELLERCEIPTDILTRLKEIRSQAD